MKCFHCEKDMDEKKDDVFMFPLERPYYNLFFHKKDCYNRIKNMESYLQENYDKIFEYIKEDETKKKKKRKKEADVEIDGVENETEESV